MKERIFCYSQKGKETALRAAEFLAKEYDAEMVLFAPERMADETFGPIPRPSGDFYGAHFSEADLFLSVGSVGICVRHIAPYVRSKVTDPAVIVIDELGRHVIPVLSGHIGGANRMAEALAEHLGGEPVVTTATDLNGRFAVDEWAARHGMTISSMKIAKDFAAAILERDLPLISDFPIKGELPGGMKMVSLKDAPYEEDLGLYITWSTEEPFGCTLRLVPRCLMLGIGCRRDTPEETIKEAVDQVIREYGIDRRAIKGIASIDLKKDEAGLLGFADKMGIEPKFYTSDELAEVEGDFTPSEFVKSVTGVDNVCERAALKEADKLIVRKKALNGVTVAVGLKEIPLEFAK